MPGVGNILAKTIMLEVGDIGRFPSVGDFCSYARCVPSQRITNDKKKGKGNRKNGNRYLSWAFAEAAHHACKNSVRVKRYYQRKASRTKPMVAWRAISNKLARAAFFIMRDEVSFKEEGIFCS
jgi:transposase